MPFVAPEAYARQVDAILDHETLSRLHAVRAPTLVLAAAEDVLTPVFLSEEIAGAIPDARLVVLPAGNHAVQLEYPEAFNAAVLGWLDSTPAKERPRWLSRRRAAPPVKREPSGSGGTWVPVG